MASPSGSAWSWWWPWRWAEASAGCSTIWLGTLPLFLLVFFVLGAVAGLLNVFRAAKQMNRDG